MISRREFIKAVGAVLTSAALPQIPRGPTPEPPRQIERYASTDLRLTSEPVWVRDRWQGPTLVDLETDRILWRVTDFSVSVCRPEVDVTAFMDVKRRTILGEGTADIAIHGRQVELVPRLDISIHFHISQRELLLDTMEMTIPERLVSWRADSMSDNLDLVFANRLALRYPAERMVSK